MIDCLNMCVRPLAFFLRCLAVLGLLLIAAGPARAGDDFLTPEAAFRFSARALDERRVEVAFDVAPGYYLYREQFRFEAAGAVLGAADIPPGQVKFDKTFEKDVETYRGRLLITVPVEQAGARFRLTVTSQGCADKGLCYPPQTKLDRKSVV
jgi:thiol:disulfide interchange protein DsbD